MSSQLDYILSAKAVRERCQLVYDKVLAGEGKFKIYLDAMPATAEFVLSVMKENYPDLNIPFHSRWRHFQVGHIDRNQKLNELLSDLSAEEKLRSKLDLAIVSVLLDAGAGPTWKYDEKGKTFSRSEGLAVASYHMFLSGAFSSDKKKPLRVDASRLQKLKVEDLSRGFQVSKENPLVGLEGRAELLRQLGRVCDRPSDVVEYFFRKTKNNKLAAGEVLRGVLLQFNDIWPSRVSFEGQNLGDVWVYKTLSNNPFEQLVPFHKLSQWLSYSLMEPLMEFGTQVILLNEMTGLPEYRNGGLFLDMGVIKVKNASLLSETHQPDSEFIVEWRALTVCLLDQMGGLVCKLAGKTAEDFPLVKVLEGGTWWAGRKIAQQKRGGTPPLNIISDGTVF